MIGTIDIEIQAKNPNLPLWPLRAYIDSPSSLRIRNVPRKIGKWEITSVAVSVTYPDKTNATAQCVLTGGIWVGTVEGSSTSGSLENGYTVIASGIDENGTPVTGYILGRGDVEILKADGTPIADDPIHFVTDDEMDEALSAKADSTVVDEVVADLNVLSTSLSDYYTKSETSSVVELSTAFGLKQDKLSDAQISALNSATDQMITHFIFQDSSEESVFVAGALDTPYLQYLNPALTPQRMLTVVQAKLGTAVTRIAENAFNGCTALTKIDIPSSVVEIGEGAFGSCYALERIEIPDGVTSVNNLFNYSSMTAAIVFGTGLQSISQGMFHYVSPSSVTFKGKTLAEVQAMTDYPWDIEDMSIIKTYNIASQEWVLEQISALAAQLQGGN